ncbi:MAG TPA: hypothetical protein VHG93_13635 [Longimicrobium sp.]|nr:hypothetical protein [Longimicrobium sp.]
MKIRSTLFAAALALLAACNTAGMNWTEPRTAGPFNSVITQEEIMATGATNLYDVVLRLRPGWLRGRGVQNFGGRTGMILVYQDHVRMGEVSALRDMPPNYVVTVRFLDAATAASLPGIRPREIVAGAIVVSTPATEPTG